MTCPGSIADRERTDSCGGSLGRTLSPGTYLRLGRRQQPALDGHGATAGLLTSAATLRVS